MIFAIVCAWIPVTLWADRTAGATEQWLLGLATTALLIGLTARGRRTIAGAVLLGWQVGIVVAFATAIELIFSGWLGVYEYRLGDVPAYVPAGH